MSVRGQPSPGLIPSAGSSSGSGRLSPLLERPQTPPPTTCLSRLRQRLAPLAERRRRAWDCVWGSWGRRARRTVCGALVAAGFVGLGLVLVQLLLTGPPSPCNNDSDLVRGERSGRRSFALGRTRESALARATSSAQAEASGYNETEAAAFAHLAAAAYCDAEELQAWRCAACTRGLQLQQVVPFGAAITDTAAYAGLTWTSAGAMDMVLVFRGTAGRRNWAADFVWGRRTQMAWGGGSVHAGFLACYLSIRASVQAVLRGLVERVRAEANMGLGSGPGGGKPRIHVVGHSLGGALALLAAADFVGSPEFDLKGVWTYGAPRVGNADFAVWLEEELETAGAVHWRLTHARDPIVHVPLRSMGFVHTSTEIYYPDAVRPAQCLRAYRVCKDGRGNEDRRCSAAIWLPLCARGGDHHLHYVGVHFDRTESCRVAG